MTRFVSIITVYTDGTVTATQVDRGDDDGMSQLDRYASTMNANIDRMELWVDGRPFCTRNASDPRLAWAADRGACLDCGEAGELTGHMTCQYPGRSGR